MSDIHSAAIILPVFNERSTIEAVVDSVAEYAVHSPLYYFLFVDDGSNDGTSDILARVINRHHLKNIAFLRCEQNRGKGHAVRVGFEMAEADILCFMDGDLAYSFDHLALLAEALQDSPVVIGSRKFQDAGIKRPSLRRYILGETYNWLVRRMLHLPFQDTQAGLKGFRLQAARQIFSKSSIDGFGFDTEILYIAQKCGFSIREIHATVSKLHSYKKGKLKLIRDSVIMFYNLLLIRWKDFRKCYD
jgi:glycosyltransferase involved in cell wall biosynthesis